ncbi:MAG: TolC family protein [Burkholderiales bacterium]|nr:TolC family protein [Burkholderiales bacterium]
MKVLLRKRLLGWCTTLLVGLLLCACAARLPYQPADLKEQAAPAEFGDRSADDATLADLVRAAGYNEQWPPAQWRLDTLTLLALYFNPDVDVVRAEALASRAALATAAKRAPLSIELAAEHHSREVDGSPWSLGVAIGLPIGGVSRREAKLEKATFIANAAEIEIAASMWRVRGSVRDATVYLTASAQRIRLLEQRIKVHDELVRLLNRRVDAGMMSARDLGRERTALARVIAEVALERTANARAHGELARAIGLPLETVQSLRIADDAIQRAIVIPDLATARGSALRNRLDVHAQLLEFGAADAEVRLAVAEQYPLFRLEPGFFWDQGDRIWSLASLVIPPVTAQALVREAEARRQVAAQRFAALQIHTISEVEQAREVMLAARASVKAAEEIVSHAQMQYERMRRYFDSGSGDRLQLASARLEIVQASQHLQEAETALLEAMAQLEDAMQLPLSGEFLKFPDILPTAGTAS